MSTRELSDEEDLVHCYECGAEIRRSAEICNECGVRQQSAPQPTVGGGVDDTPVEEVETDQGTEYLEEYSVLQWIVGILTGIGTFPIGLIVPAYLFYKASNGTGREQSGLESWTAILFGIIGIVAVEIGGRTAAKVLWGLFVVIVAAGVFVFVGA
ncbi:hypothetical protein DVK02_09930 [Halobellus sp. Atlit-31R]|nr:hypothetical protein DVK02_09930 [Halobellus sp. Atlit-31R]